MLYRPLTRFVPWLATATLAALAVMPAEGLPRFAAIFPSADAPDTAAVSVPNPGSSAGTPTPAPAKHTEAALAPVSSAPNATPVSSATRPPRPRATAAAEMPKVEAPASEGETLVSSTAVNVRSGPSSSSARLFVLQPDTPVAVAGRERGWTKVVTPDGRSGWVYGRYLVDPTGSAAARSAEEQEPRPEASQRSGAPRYARLSGSAVLRAGPSRSTQTLVIADGGERVSILERRGVWLHVVTEDGIAGWVRTK